MIASTIATAITTAEIMPPTPVARSRPSTPVRPGRRPAAGAAVAAGTPTAALTVHTSSVPPHWALLPSATRGSSTAYSTSTSALISTNAATRTSEMPCTTARSFDSAACTRYAPSPFRLNAVSTTAATAISEAIVMPDTVAIGIAALRSTCRRMSWRAGRPRLMAVWTGSRPASSRAAARAPRDTPPSEDARGQGEVLDVAPAARAVAQRREPAELHREQQDQHDRRDERRQRRGDRGRHQHRAVRPARPQGRHHAAADPDDQDDDRGVEHERAGRPHPRRDHRGHVLLQRDRDAEVAVQRVFQPVPVLGEERLVEVVALLQQVQARGRQRPPA